MLCLSAWLPLYLAPFWSLLRINLACKTLQHSAVASNVFLPICIVLHRFECKKSVVSIILPSLSKSLCSCVLEIFYTPFHAVWINPEFSSNIPLDFTMSLTWLLINITSNIYVLYHFLVEIYPRLFQEVSKWILSIFSGKLRVHFPHPDLLFHNERSKLKKDFFFEKKANKRN